MIKIKKFLQGNAIRLRLEWLYKNGYFGNIPYKQAVDGHYGPLTRLAEERAKTRLNSSQTKKPESSSLFVRAYSRPQSLGGIAIFPMGQETTLNNKKVKQQKEDKKSIITVGKRKIPLMGKQLSELARKIAEEAAILNQINPVPLYIPATGAKGHDNYYGDMTDEEVKEMFTEYLNDALRINTKNFSPSTLREFNKTINYYKKVINNPRLVKQAGGSWGFGCITNNTTYIANAANNRNLVYGNNLSLRDKILAEGNSGKCGYVIVTDGSARKGDLIMMGGPTTAHHSLMQIDNGGGNYIQLRAGTIGVGDKTTIGGSTLAHKGARGYNDTFERGSVEGKGEFGATMERIGDWATGFFLGDEAATKIRDYRNYNRDLGEGQGYYRIRYVGK